MRLTVLSDNNTFIDHYYVGEPALSFLLEDENMQILFDTGYSDTFVRNATSLGIDLSKTSLIVLSHGHNDHTRGLIFGEKKFNPRIRIMAHPDVFRERYENNRPIGSPFTFEQLNTKYELTLSKEPVCISEKCVFLGEIPCYFEFERREPVGILKIDSSTSPDFVMDDTAIVYKSDKGLFIVTGCSHSGICNIIEYAKHVCNQDKIAGVIGGFHLFSVSEKLKRTINYFKENNITNLYPCHCVSFVAKAEIHKHIPIHEVGVGLSISI
jgi:7,8-dihydropterin-6-yl-methyl-4-(beta-D-ribofuranosyl)aminobenzene 5'-phosphate synthase